MYILNYLIRGGKFSVCVMSCASEKRGNDKLITIGPERGQKPFERSITNSITLRRQIEMDEGASAYSYYPNPALIKAID